MAIRTLIVDDEPLARSGMSDYVGRLEWLAEVGQAANGLAALDFLRHTPVDLLLLDVQMPGLSGLDLVRSLTQPPAVVLTTAHPDFAVESFELDVVDYLLKPVSFARFLKAALRVRERFEEVSRSAPPVPTPAPAAAPEPVFIKHDGRLEKVDPATIYYAESMENYCLIYTTKGKITALLALKDLLAALPADCFLQVHRSYIVNATWVTALEGNQLILNEAYVPVSRSRRAEVEGRIFGGHGVR